MIVRAVRRQLEKFGGRRLLRRRGPRSIVGVALSLPPRCAIVHVYHPGTEAEQTNLRFPLCFSSVGDFICPSIESPIPECVFDVRREKNRKSIK